MRIQTFPVVPLVRASHLQPTLAVTAITTALSVSVGRGAGSVWVLLAVLTGQISVGWSNDYLDRNRDAVSKRSDKPIVAGQVSPTLVGVSAAIALVACVPLSMLSGWRAGVVHLVAVIMAWLYNIKLKSTRASAFPYIVAFGLLPAFVTLGLADHPWPRPWAMIAASLIGFGAHFVNVLPDLETDRITGVNGLPHRLGFLPSLVLGTLCISSSTIIIATAATDSTGRLRIALVAVAVGNAISIGMTGLVGKHRTAWTLTLIMVGLNVVVLLANGASITSN